MNFNNFRKQISDSFTDKDIDNLTKELNTLSNNGKVNEAAQMLAVCNVVTEKCVNLIEQYHNWLLSNFDIHDKN